MKNCFHRHVCCVEGVYRFLVVYIFYPAKKLISVCVYTLPVMGHLDERVRLRMKEFCDIMDKEREEILEMADRRLVFPKRDGALHVKRAGVPNQDDKETVAVFTEIENDADNWMHWFELMTRFHEKPATLKKDRK